MGDEGEITVHIRGGGTVCLFHEDFRKGDRIKTVGGYGDAGELDQFVILQSILCTEGTGSREKGQEKNYDPE